MHDTEFDEKENISWSYFKNNNNKTLGEKIKHNCITVIFFNHIIMITPKIHCMQKVLNGVHCVLMIRMEPPPLHFEKEKTLSAGLYIIWIISQKQKQQLCLILLHRTDKNNTLIFHINIFMSKFISIKVWLFYLLVSEAEVLQNYFIVFNKTNNYYKAFSVLVFDQHIQNSRFRTRIYLVASL